MQDSYDQNLPPGSTIDHYEIRQILGIGGFGVTYKAWDKMLDRWVAIKEFLPTDLAVRDQASTTVKARSDRTEDYQFALEKFLQEAKTLARFDHPNIVRVTRFLEANGTGYLVMDFVDGQSLSQYLKHNPGSVPEEQLKAWFVPILRGLSEVHAAGFLHRDIKPGNIYLRDTGEPLLIDFGAARQAIGEHSRSVTGIVSAGYAPTEQYGTDAKKQGPWTDLYSIGATLYRCILGKDPVDAPTRQSALVEGDPDPMDSARDAAARNYSCGLLRLVDDLMVLPIRQRPQHTDSVLRALESGQAVGPEEPRSTVVTQLVQAPPAPADTASGLAGVSAAFAGSAPQPTPGPAGSAPVGQGQKPTRKVIYGLILLGCMVGAALFLGSYRSEVPAVADSTPPPVSTVKPEPQSDTPAAPAPVASNPVSQNPEPVVVEPVVTEPVVVEPVLSEPLAPEPVASEPPPQGQLVLTVIPAHAEVVIPDIGPRYQRIGSVTKARSQLGYIQISPDPGMQLSLGDKVYFESGDKYLEFKISRRVGGDLVAISFGEEYPSLNAEALIKKQ